MLKKVIKNSGYLYIIKILNLGSPIFLIPILTANIEISELGSLFFFQAFAIFLSLFIEYGFNLTGTAEVAASEDTDERKKVFCRLVQLKLVLSIPIILISSALWYLGTGVFENKTLLVLATLSGILQGFSPAWYFHGIENMKKALLIDGFVSLAYFCLASVLIYLFKDAYLVLLVQVLVRLLTYSFVYKNIVSISTLSRFQDPMSLVIYLKEGFPVFLFRLVSSIYTKSTILIVGLYATSTEVAFYAGGEKICKGATGLMSPVTQSLFPRMSSLILKGGPEAKKLFVKALLLLMSVSLILMFSIQLLSSYIVLFVFGEGFFEVINVIYILSFLIPIITLSNLFGVQLLIPLKKYRDFNKVIIVGALFYGICTYFVISNYGYLGMAVLVVVVELLVAILMFITSYSKTNFWIST